VHSSGSSAASFFRSRFLRLVPTAWLCASVTFLSLLIIGLYQPLASLKLLLRTLVFWPVAPWVDPVYWTLAIEIAFYGIVWLLLLLNRKNWLEPVLIFVGSVSSVYWFALLISHNNIPQSGLSVRLLQLSLVFDGCLFATGALIWSLFFERSRWWTVPLLSLFCVADIIRITIFNAERIASGGQNVLVPLALWGASILAIILSVRYNVWLSRQLNPLLARAMGSWTYPLYLCHYVIGASVMALVAQFGGSIGLVVALGIACPLVITICLAKYLEPPFRSFMAAVYDAFYSHFWPEKCGDQGQGGP
jgi:peptidoglycan/LPS O-acetylase OafA/YrhL